MNEAVESSNFECTRIVNSLNGLNERYKQSESLRGQNGPSQLRTLRVLHRVFQTFLLKDFRSVSAADRNECILSGLKLLRNTAAAFKSSVLDDEVELCRFLISVLRVYATSVESDQKDSEFDRDFQIITMQYFCNLIRGNSAAYEKLKDEWTALICQLLSFNLKVLKADNKLLELASMVLVELVNASKHSESQFTVLTQELGFDTYLQLLANIFKTFGRDELGDFDLESEDEIDFCDSLRTHRPNAFRLAEILFDSYAAEMIGHLDLDGIEEDETEEPGLLLSKIQNEPHEKRLGFIRILNYKSRKLSPLDPSAEARKANYFNCMTSLYRQASEKCLEIMESQQPDTTLSASNASFKERVGEFINQHLEEIKYLADSLSDFLVLTDDVELPTSTVKGHLIKIQSNRFIFNQTCHILRQLTSELVRNKQSVPNTDDRFRQPQDKSQEKTPEKLTGFRLVKCKLIRFVGILVYDNELNQNLLYENKCLDALTTNLGIDEDNPFLREWSIVALRHILTKLDLK